MGDQERQNLISSIVRMNLGKAYMYICTLQTHDIISLANDENADLAKKKKMLIDLFSMYEKLPETSFFKNSYFVCIIHVLLTLFIVNKASFKFAFDLLLNLLKDGKITLETYREIVAQLLAGGISPVEILIE
jgi:hypothetical protein